MMVKSKAFALEVIRACRILREARCESALINQFLRSGTSIGANIHEAFYAQGKADFIAKLHIALKECSDSCNKGRHLSVCLTVSHTKFLA